MESTNLMTTEQQEVRIVDISDSVKDMAFKLESMKSKLGLVQRFFKEVMVEGQDYGVIPGTDKPTLLKPGAEKLNELYGYAPVVKHVDEDIDRETGYYRARVTVALIHRRTGITVAEGVGEANTMEGRYRWRWVPEWKLPQGFDKNTLYCEERKNKKGETFKMYRLENNDPWTLWNTVLKMGKKRGLIDATLSATRSSGLFTQDLEDLQDWVDSDEEKQVRQNYSNQASKQNKGNNGPKMATEPQQKRLFAMAREAGIPTEELKQLLKEATGKESTKELTMEEMKLMFDVIEAKASIKSEAEAGLDEPCGINRQIGT